MQDKYVGDIGDFGKYYLLRNLIPTGLKLGVNWCVATDKKEDGGGQDTKFLHKKSSDLEKSDPSLFQQLKSIVETGQRTFHSIEQSDIFKTDTAFFKDAISTGLERFLWHQKSLEQLEACDIIFYDPDNGLEIGSFGKLSPNTDSTKYIFFDELKAAFEKGKSLIVYQHANRGIKIETQIQERIKGVLYSFDPHHPNIRVLRFHRGNARFFLIIQQPRHETSLNAQIELIGKIPFFTVK